MGMQNAPPSQPSRHARLPLVDVAVQAVSRAAQAYSQALVSVASLPVAAVASRGRRSAKPGKSKLVRKRRGKRRTLLSFDDAVVAPLIDDDREPPQSALYNYLNSPLSRLPAATAH